MRLARKLMLWITIPVLVLAVAATGLLLSIDPQKFLSETRRQIAVAGLNVNTGPAETTWWPVPGIIAREVSAKKADGPEARSLSAQEMVILPSLWALMDGQVKPGSIILRNAEIDLGDADAPLFAPSRDLDSRGLSLGRLWLIDLRLTGRFQPDAPAVTLENARIYASLAGISEGLRLNAAGEIDGKPAELSAFLNQPLSLRALSGTGLTGTLTLGADTLTYDGRIGFSDEAPNLLLRGRLEGDVQDPAGLAERLSLPPPPVDTIEGLTIEADLRVLPAELRVRGSARGDLAERHVGLNVSLRGDAGWVETGRANLEVVARSGGLFSARATGAYDHVLGFAGDASLSALDLQALIDWAGLVPPGQIVLGRNASIQGFLSARPNAIALREGSFRVDDEEIGGLVSIDAIDGSLRLSGALEADDLYLGSVLTSPRRRIRMQRVLDVLDKHEISLDLELAANSVLFGDVVLGRTEARVTRRKNGLDVTLDQLEFLDGVAGGVAAVDLTTPPGLTADLTFAEIDMTELGAMTGISMASGRLSGTMKMSLTDISAAPTQSTLGLEADVTAFNGEMALPVQGLGALPFRQMTGRVRVQDGVLQLAEVSTGASGQRLSGGEIQLELDTKDLSGFVILAANDGGPKERLAVAGTADAPTLSPSEIDAGEKEIRSPGFNSRSPDGSDSAPDAPDLGLILAGSAPGVRAAQQEADSADPIIDDGLVPQLPNGGPTTSPRPRTAPR